MAERDGNAGKDFLRQGRDAQFVGAIQIGVDQGDGQRLDAPALEGFELGADVGLIDGANLAAPGVHAALDLHGVF